MIFYAITDRSQAPNGAWLDHASAWVRGGVDWVQVREKDLPDRTRFAATKVLAQEAKRFGAKVLLNGRADMAAAAGASGVHLPSDGLPTARVRQLFPRPFLIVRSCHTEEEVRLAACEGADAVTLGPVYATPSKAALGPPMGLERFARIAASAPIPVLALGGVGVAEVPEVMAAGAAGVAAIRMFCGLRSPIEEFPALKASLLSAISRQSAT